MSDNTPDQYTFDDPRTRYPVIEPPVQQQDEPGLQSRMDPVPDLGEATYRGTGRLTGRRALITGADSGIGGAVAIAFAREGADVTMSYLPRGGGRPSTSSSRSRRPGAPPPRCPVTSPTRRTAGPWSTPRVEAMGGLDAVVNVAGKQVWQERLEDFTDEQFEATYRTNVFAAFWIIKAAVPHLGPGSTIVNTASLEAYQPAPDRFDYASTKGAVNNLSKGLAQDLISRGIRVNVVAPGPVWSALQVTRGVDPETLPEYGRRRADRPVGPAGREAPAYVFLTSAESSFVVGSTLAVDRRHGHPLMLVPALSGGATAGDARARGRRAPAPSSRPPKRRVCRSSPYAGQPGSPSVTNADPGARACRRPATCGGCVADQRAALGHVEGVEDEPDLQGVAGAEHPTQGRGAPAELVDVGGRARARAGPRPDAAPAAGRTSR